MSAFFLTGNSVQEEVNKKHYVSLYCYVQGSVRFSRIRFVGEPFKKPQDDESGKQLVRQIRILNKSYPAGQLENVLADIVMDNVIVVRFLLGGAHTLEIVAQIYDTIHTYCLIEEALKKPLPQETFEDLFRQTSCLLQQLEPFETSKGSSLRIEYLINSIRYGTLDVFGGIIPSAPQNLMNATVKAWLKQIQKLTEERRGHSK